MRPAIVPTSIEFGSTRRQRYPTAPRLVPIVVDSCCVAAGFRYLMGRSQFPPEASMRHRAARIGLLSVFTLFLLLSFTAYAQIAGGAIQGTVMDATGAALPGASVEIKNLDTNSVERRTFDVTRRRCW